MVSFEERLRFSLRLARGSERQLVVIEDPWSYRENLPLLICGGIPAVDRAGLVLSVLPLAIWSLQWNLFGAPLDRCGGAEVVHRSCKPG